MFKLLVLCLVAFATNNVGAQTTTTEEPLPGNPTIVVTDNQLTFVFQVDFNTIDVADFTQQVTDAIVASGVPAGSFTVTLVEGSVVAIVTANDAAAAEGIKAAVDGSEGGEIQVTVDGQTVGAPAGDVGVSPDPKVDGLVPNGVPGGPKKGKKNKGPQGPKGKGKGKGKGKKSKKGDSIGAFLSSSLSGGATSVPIVLAGAVLVAGVVAVAVRRHRRQSGYSTISRTVDLAGVEVTEITPLVE